ncbi:MAG: hypothetical protein ABH856_03400 [Patescibacteria group bacterium]
MINTAEILDVIFKLGSLAGLAGLIYQIHNNKKLRPQLQFTFEGSHAEFFDRDKLKFCNYHFQGIFKNSSLTPNSIVRLYLTVWDNKKKGSTLRFGHTIKEIKDTNTQERKYLPLRFEAKQAFNLQVIFEFPITGTQDGKILTQVERLGNADLFMPKYQYQFVIEDVNGNYFDYNSSFVSRELIDLWWTLPNYSKNPVKYIKQLGKIGLIFTKNVVRQIVEFLGFYK